MSNFGPIVLIEVVLVFGGVLVFVIWQLNDIKKEKPKDQQQNNSKEE